MKDHVGENGEFRWADAESTDAHGILWPRLWRILADARISGAKRCFDLGCGNGATAAMLNRLGWEVEGVDASSEGIGQANRAHPNLRLVLGSAYDDLYAKFGAFPVVVSLEVVEHLYDPRTYARTLRDLCEPGGLVVISTPYHSYLKNLVLSLTGKMDAHFTALWDHGHIKFWSIRTLSTLLEEAGLVVEEVHRVGRIPILAKSMIIVARRSA